MAISYCRAATSAAVKVCVVGLVDGDHVDQFQQPAFDALQIITGTGQHQRQETIGHVGNHRLGLADADRFHQHDLVTCRFADQHAFARLAGHSAQRAGRGRGTNVSVGLGRESRHPRFVAQNAAAADAAGRIHRQDRNSPTAGASVAARVLR